jgi:hypothetical protein
LHFSKSLANISESYPLHTRHGCTKEKPNPKWYNVNIERQIAAAQNLGKVGDAVIELTGKVRKILTGGLL